MSVGGLGGSSTAYLSQSLQALLAQLSNVSPTSDATSSAASTPASQTASSADSAAASNQLTGSPTGALSAEIIQILMQMQMQAQQDSPATTPSSSSASISATSSQDPLQKLFSTMDGNGDGTISQAEMESFIQKQGGTQSQADQLYAALTKNGSSTLTQTQFAQDLQQAQPMMQAMGGHHHHHHADGESGMPPTADAVGSQLVQAMGGSASSSVDQSQFEAFVQSQGGTKSEADTDFAGINSSGSGSISSTQFADAISAFENASQSGAANSAVNGNAILTMLDGAASAEQANVKPAS